MKTITLSCSKAIIVLFVSLFGWQSFAGSLPLTCELQGDRVDNVIGITIKIDKNGKLWRLRDYYGKPHVSSPADYVVNFFDFTFGETFGVRGVSDIGQAKGIVVGNDGDDISLALHDFDYRTGEKFGTVEVSDLKGELLVSGKLIGNFFGVKGKKQEDGSTLFPLDCKSQLEANAEEALRQFNVFAP